jgi:putative GTP pyrophosphokinase
MPSSVAQALGAAEMNAPIPLESLERIDSLVHYYEGHLLDRANRLAQNLLLLVNDSRLRPLIHSTKMRAKNPENLRDKLHRKMHKCIKSGEVFDIDEDNLFLRINDLAGIRILHLHTAQVPAINKTLTVLLQNELYEIIEGPIARIWDEEYENIFRGYGIEAVKNNRLYTSVHYVVSAGNKDKIHTAEIQVRTLAEELWGEVDHSFNYPHPTDIRSCQEQIKVLARVTSSCTRLVDSIFLARELASQPQAAPINAPPPTIHGDLPGS